jgi:hypothetical protein
MALSVATQAQADRLRADVGATVTSLPDADVDAIFTEAAEIYSDVASQTAYTRIIAIRRLLASSAKLTDYTQNESRESMSQIFKHLRDLLAFWQGELAAIGSVDGAARFGRTAGIPARVKEYPGQ